MRVLRIPRRPFGLFLFAVVAAAADVAAAAAGAAAQDAKMKSPTRHAGCGCEDAF